jgi:hypothetical protein
MSSLAHTWRGPSSAPECLFIYAKVVRAERRLAVLQGLLNARVAVLPKDQMVDYVEGSEKLEQQQEARDAD